MCAAETPAGKLGDLACVSGHEEGEGSPGFVPGYRVGLVTRLVERRVEGGMMWLLKLPSLSPTGVLQWSVLG